LNSREHCKGWGSLKQFGGEEVAHGFASADESGVISVYKDFGGAGAGVVVGGLRHAVGSGVEEQDQVVWFDGREDAVAGEEVARFADGTYDVGC